MGTRMAPSHANIFMAALGKQMLLQSLHNLQPLTWLRIIDDIFMLWTHDPKPLLTSFNPSTHFIPQSKSATNNPTPPSTSWTPPSNSRNNEHCSPHFILNPPTKDYYSTRLITAKLFHTDVLSPTTMSYTNIYGDYTKSSWPEGIPTPQSPLHSTKSLHTHKASYSSPRHHQ